MSSSTSTRPLEQIKRDTKAANRAPHLRKKNFVGADPIDALDNVGIGGAYHHGGPYDATLAQRNRDARYAPVAAVKESNMEALRATPQEYVLDSLRKHVPLQGTATVPPGMKDHAGRRMNYKEGADLMREPDAPGGPYKRYEHVAPITSANTCPYPQRTPKESQFWDWYKKSWTASMRGGKTLQEIQLARISDHLYQRSQTIRNKRMPSSGTASTASSSTALTSITTNSSSGSGGGIGSSTMASSMNILEDHTSNKNNNNNTITSSKGGRDTRTGEHSSNISHNHTQHYTQTEQWVAANKRHYSTQQYHPDDLKGKGEPSYTIERDLKERKHAAHKKTQSTNGSSRHRHSTQTNEYEMYPATGYSTSSHAKNDGHVSVRNRSYSVGADSSRSSSLSVDSAGQRHRSGSTGKRISEGLKRRLGSLRGKHGDEA